MMDQEIQLLLRRFDNLSDEFHQLSDRVQKVAQLAELDPEMALTRVRKILESIIRDVYTRRCEREPKTQPLENLLQQLLKEGYITPRIEAYATTIRKLGNVGAHSFDEQITMQDVQSSLNQLLPILLWYFEDEHPLATGKGQNLAEQSQPEDRRDPKPEEIARDGKLPAGGESPVAENKEEPKEENKIHPTDEPLPANMMNRLGMEFVWIPPGSFMMGSEKGGFLDNLVYGDEQPIHQVNFKNGFYIGKYQVTQTQWQALMAENPSHFKGGNLPVEQVKWDQADLFINRLNKNDDRYTYRLPSEAEWEYACRAGTTGNFAGELGSMAWYKNNSGNSTHPVGNKAPNAFGVYDMHGNVWEWCQDWYHNNYSYYGMPTDGSAWMDRNVPSRQYPRIVRGGAWNSKTNDCRSAYRFRFDPDWRIFSYVGFRVVAVLKVSG